MVKGTEGQDSIPLGLARWVRKRAGLVRLLSFVAFVALAFAALGPRGFYASLCFGVLVLLLLLSVACWLGPRREDLAVVLLTAVVAFLFSWLGGIRAETISASSLGAEAGEERWWVVRLDERAKIRGVGASAPAAVVGLDSWPSLAHARAPHRVWLESDDTTLQSLAPGTVVRVFGSLEEPQVALPGDRFNQKRYLLTKGIGWVLRVKKGTALEVIDQASGLDGLISVLRDRVCHALSLGVPPAHSSLMQGILLGVKDGIPKDIREQFRLSGLSHLLTVSGAHIAWLLAGCLAALRLIQVPKQTALLAACFLLVFFASLTDGGPSVLRATTVGLLVIGARLLGRATDPWQSLFMAAVVILLGNPYLLFSPGMQLSFTAVAGILAFAKVIRAHLKTLPGLVADVGAVTLAATIGTAPVTLLQFGQIPLGSLPANILVGPVMPLILGLCFTAGFVGLVWPSFALFVNQATAVLVSWSMWVARLCSRIPVVPRSAGGLLLGVAVGALCAVAALRFTKFGRRICSDSVRRRGLVVAAAAVVGGLAAFPAGWFAEHVSSVAAHLSWPRQGEIAILDVGQGSATLIRTPQGASLLVDAGPKGQGLEYKLRRLGVRRLDMVIVSHPHEDHFGGLGDILGRIPIGCLIDGAAANGEWNDRALRQAQSGAEAQELAHYLDLRAELERSGSCCTTIDNDISFALAGSLIHIFTPRVFGAEASDLNDLSLVVYAAVDGASVLICGDCEAPALEKLELPSADVLVVGHHGSRGSVSTSLLAIVRPDMGVISVGRYNRFGHPHQETLEVLDREGVQYVRTDQVGTVRIGGSSSPGYLRVAVSAKPSAPP